jgi:hypothetical protein
MSDVPTLTYPLTDHQTIFNHVWHHFVTAGNPPSIKSHDDYQCVYSGTGCAVGCLLPRRVANRWDTFEDTSITAIVDHHYRSFTKYFGTDESIEYFLIDLQHIHDDYVRPYTKASNGFASFTDYMTAKLTDVAADYGLEVPNVR